MTDKSLPDRLWAGRTPENTPLVKFEWKDIRSTDRWNDEEETVRPARRIASAGYIVYEGPDPHDPAEDVVILANHYDYEEERWSEFTCFPVTVPRTGGGLP